MKEIINYFKLVKMLNKANIHLAYYQILENIMNFANQVHEEKKPMLTKIAAINMVADIEPSQFDIVSIWAGVGDSNPIERIRHLKAQNDAMKELLNKCRGTIEVGSNNNLIMNINIILDTFE